MLKTQQNSRAKKKKIKFASKCCHGLQLLKEMKRRDEYRCALKDVALKSNKKKKCVKKKKTNVTTENGKRHIFTLVEQMAAKTSVLWIILKKGK